jgi:hypothetical protein
MLSHVCLRDEKQEFWLDGEIALCDLHYTDLLALAYCYSDT